MLKCSACALLSLSNESSITLARHSDTESSEMFPQRDTSIMIKSSRLTILLLLGSAMPASRADDPSTNDVVNLSSEQIAKLRQFPVETVRITSSDGYYIRLTHIFPVKETNKRPVIFNHGSTQSSTYFMVNSVNARPRDYSNLNASSWSQAELEKLLLNDPQTTSFPLLLSSFGHHVYLVDRRGTEFSLGKESASVSINPVSSLTGGLVGRQTSDEPPDRSWLSTLGDGLKGLFSLLLKPQLNLASIPNTLNANYWNFSLDEQAANDLPAIITYVLNETKSNKVAYVGHSLGNALMFMLQSQQPEWADKVEPFLAWSPDIYLGHTTSILRPLLVTLQPILTSALIPFPPTPIDPLTRSLLALLCQTKLAQDTVCRLLDNAQFGFSGDQQRTLPAFVATQFYSISSHEAVQLAQDTEKGKMHFYDYGDPQRNTAAYGQAEAPIYNLTRIRSRSISLWHGGKDNLASPTDVEILKQDLSVPVDDRFITEVPFGHYDLLFGVNVTQLVNIPSLKVIESYA